MIATVVGVVLAAAPVLTPTPQFTQDWICCANSGHAFSLDLSISGCSAVIQFGRELPRNLSIAFYNRANALFGKGDLDSAIADYDRAIQQLWAIHLRHRMDRKNIERDVEWALDWSCTGSEARSLPF